MEWGIKLGFIVVAVLIVIGIIWDSRRQRVRNKRHYREPTIHAATSTDATHTDGHWEDVVIVKKQATRAKAIPVEPVREDVISFSVMARPGYVFDGRDIERVAGMLHLKLGDRHIFHRYEDQTGTNNKLFSMASAVKPGTFETELAHFSTPGLTLFLRQTLPGKSMVAFEMMVRTARQLAEDLEGELWDDQRQRLTPEALDSYRERIKAASQRYGVA